MEQETKSLLTFLTECRVGPAEAKSANVRGFPGPQVGNYKVKPKDYDEFLDALYQYIFVEGEAANDATRRISQSNGKYTCRAKQTSIILIS